MKNVEFISNKLSYVYRRFDCVPENLNSRHCHDKYEILYVAEGEGKYNVEGIEYPVGPRTLMIFPPLSYHCVTIKAGCSYERFVINFGEDALLDDVRGAFEKIKERSENLGAYFTPDAISDKIVSVIERFENASSIEDEARELYIRLLLSELVLLLSTTNPEIRLRDEGELGARVIKYLNQNMDLDVSLDHLAKRFFVSKYYLCRAFKRYNGVSVHGYINRKRIMYAKQLIEAGEPASVAAYKVGFGDYSAFYRAYMKIIGKAPTKAVGVNDDA